MRTICLQEQLKLHQQQVRELLQEQEERLSQGFSSVLAAAIANLAPVSDKRWMSAVFALFGRIHLANVRGPSNSHHGKPMLSGFLGCCCDRFQ